MWGRNGRGSGGGSRRTQGHRDKASMGQTVPLQEVVAVHDPKTGWSEKVSGRLLGRTAPKRLASDAG